MKKQIVAPYQPIEGLTYDVAGLFTHTKLLLELMDCIETRLGYKVPITSIYGAEHTSWNGGRYTYNKGMKEWKEELVTLAERAIVPVFTFTNTSIHREMLKDKIGNELLEFVTSNHIKCEARIVSGVLKEYIETRYPAVKLNASVITVTMDRGVGDSAYYHQLAQMYNKYVVHPDDNFNYALLTQIDKEKAEILLNERCTYKCQNRMDHYLAIDTLIKTGNKEPQNKVLKACMAIPEIKQNNNQRRNISLSMVEMEKLIALGFRHFKIQGRVDNLYTYVYDVIRYILRDEYLVAQIYIPFCEIVKKHIID